MSRQSLDLGGPEWTFGQVPPQPFTTADSYDLPAVAEWLPATVPGNVRPDLLALNHIPDPFFARQYQESLWVEAVDWWYRCSIDLAPLLPQQRAFLCFEGIDYLSAIFVNGQELTRHEGMFSRQIIEITGALQTIGQVELGVRLWGSNALATRSLNWRQHLWQYIASRLANNWVGIYPDRSATLKCQMSFGWDFAPPIRTMGIWDEVKLIICEDVFIREAWILSALNYRGLCLYLTLDALHPQPGQVVVQVSPANFAGQSFGPFLFSVNLSGGQSQLSFNLPLPQALLWQPWDRGEPYLYLIEITFTDEKGEALDQTTIRTGLRTITLEEWQFQLNGQREFIRGLNWVPADCFPGRLRQEDYTRLLVKARACGANLIRVWGGGLREKRAFYDLCDELGLLVWQEFPFACMFLGAYPRDATYLAKIEAECGAIVRQICHHPALVLWCGGNEFSAQRNRPLLDTLAGVVQKYDETRPFIRTSPGHFQGKDAHNWHVWHGNAPISSYQTETASFLSEFGLQALPHLETLQAMLPDPATGWVTHHADLPKLQRYLSIFSTPNPSAETSHQVQVLISASQRAQALALQVAIEHMRRRKGEAGGVCLWQLNEPWPAISWAILDYFGRPKLAFESLSAWYQPVLISLKFPLGRQWSPGEIFKAEIWAINDSLQPYKGVYLEIYLDHALSHTQILDLPADSSYRAGHLVEWLTTSPRLITLTLYHNDHIIAQNHYDLTWQDNTRVTLYQRLRRWVAELALW